MADDQPGTPLELLDEIDISTEKRRAQVTAKHGRQRQHATARRSRAQTPRAPQAQRVRSCRRLSLPSTKSDNLPNTTAASSSHGVTKA